MQAGFVIEKATPSHARAFFIITHARWKSMEPWATKFRTIQKRLRNSPGCHFLARLDGEYAGALSILRAEPGPLAQTWSKLTGKGTWSTHVQDGNALFCPQISVLQQHEGKGIAKKLVAFMLNLAEKESTPIVAAYSRFGAYGRFLEEYRELQLDVPLSAWDYLKVSKPAKENARPEDGMLAEISRMPEGIEAYFAYVFAACRLGLETGINAFYENTKRRVYDATIEFHRSLGAKIGAVICGGCPDDRAAGGNNVIMLHRGIWPGGWEYNPPTHRRNGNFFQQKSREKPI